MKKCIGRLCRLGWGLALLWGAGPVHAEDALFDVFEYRVEGATLLPRITVEESVYPYLGEGKTLADVEQAREALEKAYHAAGWLTVLVAVPPQKVDAKMVRLTVTEAPVDRLRVVESRYFSLGEIRAGVPELAEGQVPNFPQMQKELAALNKSPDRRITPVLRPGKTPGTVEVDLKVQDRLPLHGNVELNDRTSQDTTRTRLTASLRWDNLWQQQHALGITVQTAPQEPDESRVFSASYTWPLASGDYLAFYAVKSDSDVAAVGTLNGLGKGTIAGARYIMPLRSRRFEIEPELTSRVAILRRSEWLGFPPIAAPRHPPDPQALAALTEALARMNEDEDGKAVLAMLRLDGFAPQEASLFDPIAAKAALVAGTG